MGLLLSWSNPERGAVIGIINAHSLAQRRGLAATRRWTQDPVVAAPAGAAGGTSRLVRS